MRGEDFLSSSRIAFRVGSPPHARGRQSNEPLLIFHNRITPACAGKTRRRRLERRLPVGSPPHARGRPFDRFPYPILERITPACAGKTFKTMLQKLQNPDHPRMRGEDPAAPLLMTVAEGSPPHARGRLPAFGTVKPAVGITPACAGKTQAESPGYVLGADHPRMRGEDLSCW